MQSNVKKHIKTCLQPVANWVNIVVRRNTTRVGTLLDNPIECIDVQQKADDSGIKKVIDVTNFDIKP